jgi:adenosylcobinamide kinase/adenosylcobinamide-phosphate guanylyltransferase
MTGHFTLVLGGARSGKSAWAERHVAESGRPVLYVATATAGDDEMTERIAAHRARRPAHWYTVEAPTQLLPAIQTSATPGDAVLVDCLTLWVSNALLAAIAEQDPEQIPPATWATAETALVGEVRALIEFARARDLHLVLVSNEVGMGIVPATPLGRGYRDILGRVNQAVTSEADAVMLMIAGLAVDLRRLATLQVDGLGPLDRDQGG